MVVVMFLLFNTSCGKDKKEVVDVVFNPETTYTLKSENYSTLVSDSGITRYRVNSKELQYYGKAAETYWYCPEGVYVEKFDTLFNVVASVKADTAYYWDKKGLIKLVKNVEINDPEGKNIQTSLLYWDEKEALISSDKPVRIQDGERIIWGEFGFETNQDMSDYKLYSGSGEFPIRDISPADSTQVSSDSVQVAVPPTP